MHDILLPFGLIIAAGMLFRRLKIGVIDADTIRSSINSLVLNLFLPALCLKTLAVSPIGREAALIPLTAWITTGAALFLALAVYRLPLFSSRLSPQERGVFVLSSAYGNVTYLGLPVLTGLFGAAAARYALFYDLLATTPSLWLIGAAVASRHGGGGAMGVRDSVMTVLKLPPLWGIAAGMLLNFLHISLPQPVLKTLDLFGSLVVPLMIFSIGLALTFPQVAHAYAVLPAVVIKMVLSPALSLLIAQAVGLDGEVLVSCVIEGAMPTMVLSLLIAARFGLDVSLSAFAIVVTTALSFLTLPLVASLAGAVAH